MRLCLGFVAFLALSACDLVSLAGFRGETRISVTQDSVYLTGAKGFCVDRESSTLGSDKAFVVFGNCATISDNANADQPAHQALVTVTVTRPDPSVPKIAEANVALLPFFDTPVGQGLLSRDNRPDSVSVSWSRFENAAFLIHFEDKSAGKPVGTENTYWRAYLDVRNSLVTVSVLSLSDAPLSDDIGDTLLQKFVAAIQSDPQNVLSETAS